ncbi:MAG: hypothetical protein OEV16_06860 [Gammaproteobacteria bacterium]|nr:hypothetical protein [Gammaproteobacteria bacterium]
MYTALTVLVTANLSGCGDNEPTSGKVLPVAPAASSALTAERLQNVSYTGILESPVTLTDGRFEGAPFTSDSASRPVVTLVPDSMANGDLSGDGTDEAVVVLAHNSGGSGVFLYLAIMQDDRGNPYNMATISLGDRVKVSTIDINDGRIIAELVEHGANDPMCCPTRQVRREWSFRDGLAVPLEQAAQMQGGRFRGHLVWGHESRTFASCDDGREGWVINESGAELEEVYRELTSTPYQPMFVEVRGEWVAAPTEGFGADFGEGLRVTELIRAENEGFGCRLELDEVLFVASGNEPFWHLQIREDGISMRSMDTPGEVEFPPPRMRDQPPSIMFEAETPESAIRVSLVQRRCIDTMSGARYAWAATVDASGRQFNGCATEGL